MVEEGHMANIVPWCIVTSPTACTSLSTQTWLTVKQSAEYLSFTDLFYRISFRNIYSCRRRRPEINIISQSGQCWSCCQWRQSQVPVRLSWKQQPRGLAMLEGAETVSVTQRLAQINTFIMELTTSKSDQDKDTTYGEARVTFSGSWANDKAVDLQWASSMENKGRVHLIWVEGSQEFIKSLWRNQ